MGKRSRTAWALGLATLLVTGSAFADSASDNAALRDQANQAMTTGRPADALAGYEKVFAATKDPALLYNIARAHMALANYPLADEYLHRFKAEAPEDLRKKITNLDSLLAEVLGHIHRLTLQIDVAGAEARLGDRVLGKSPFESALAVNAGALPLEVRAEGYAPYTRRLQLAGGTASTVDVKLVRLDTSGTLVVRTKQSGADVAVDGIAHGNAPLELRLAPGDHDIDVTKSGFDASRTHVILATGERKETDIDLAKKPSIFTRWWFWTAVGVVIAGGVVTAIALTTEKDAPTGSLPPGQVSVGQF